jgi:hypothetical protein
LHLLQSELSVAHETFSQFLRLFPFCYGYWKKYAELVRRLAGGEVARDVLEDGVAAIPLSVDLWLHFASFATTHYKDSPQAEQLIRRSHLLSPHPPPTLKTSISQQVTHSASSFINAFISEVLNVDRAGE